MNKRVLLGLAAAAGFALAPLATAQQTEARAPGDGAPPMAQGYGSPMMPPQGGPMMPPGGSGQPGGGPMMGQGGGPMGQAGGPMGQGVGPMPPQSGDSQPPYGRGMMGSGPRGGMGPGMGMSRSYGPGMGMSGMHGMTNPEAILGPVLALNLTGQQQQQAGELMQKLRRGQMQNMAQMMAEMAKLQGLYDTENWDVQAIDQSYRKIFDMRREGIMAAVQARQEAMKMLTDEQRKQLAAMSGFNSAPMQ